MKHSTPAVIEYDRWAFRRHAGFPRFAAGARSRLPKGHETSSRPFGVSSAAFAALLAFSSPVQSADFDGSKDLLCAAQLAVDCGRDDQCEQGLPEGLNIPQFFVVSVKDNSIRGTRPDQSEIDTTITTKTVDSGQLILQGVENGRGWTAAIAQESGHMVVSVSAEDVAFVVFGACTVKP